MSDQEDLLLEEQHEHGGKRSSSKQEGSEALKKKITTIKKTMKGSKCGNCRILLQEIEKLQDCKNCDYLQKRLDEYQEDLEKHQAEIQSLKECENCEELDKSYQECLKKIGEMSSQIIKLKNCQNCKRLQKENAELNEELDDKLQEIKMIKICENCKNYRTEIVEMQEEIETQKKKLKEQENCASCKALKKKLDDKDKEIDDLKNQITDLKDCDKCKNKDDEIKNMQKQLDAKDQEIEDNKNCEHCVNKDKEIINNQSKVSEKQKEIDSLKEENKDLKKQLEELQKQIDQDCKDCQQKQNTINDLAKQVEDSKQPEEPKEIKATLPMEDEPKECKGCEQLKEQLAVYQKKFMETQPEYDCSNCKELILLVKELKQKNESDSKPINCQNCKQNQQQNTQENKCGKCDDIYGVVQSLVYQSRSIQDQLSNQKNSQPTNDFVPPFQNKQPTQLSGPSREQPLSQQPHKCQGCSSLQEIIVVQKKDNSNMNHRLNLLESELKTLRNKNISTIINRNTEIKRSVIQPQQQPKTEYKQTYISNYPVETKKIKYSRPVVIEKKQTYSSCNNTHSCYNCLNNQIDFKNLQVKNSKLEQELNIIKQQINQNNQVRKVSYESSNQQYKPVTTKVYTSTTTINKNNTHNVNQRNTQCNTCQSSSCPDCQEYNCHQYIQERGPCQECQPAEKKLYCMQCSSLNCQVQDHTKTYKFVWCCCNVDGCENCQVCLCTNDQQSCIVCKCLKINQSKNEFYKSSYQQLPLNEENKGNQVTTNTRVVKRVYGNTINNDSRQSNRIQKYSLKYKSLNDSEKQLSNNNYQKVVVTQTQTQEPLFKNYQDSSTHFTVQQNQYQNDQDQHHQHHHIHQQCSGNDQLQSSQMIQK